MLALERRNLILEKLQEDKRVVVSELSQKFKVSEETIRRDLDKLEQEGLAIKSYGGAVLNENHNIDMPFNIRKNKNVVAKQKIAELAVDLVNDADRIMIDASTTGVFIARALKTKSRLTVVTNSIETLIELSDMPDWNVISTGGTVKGGYLSILGSAAISSIDNYRVDSLFLSCKGMDMEKGLMDSNEGFAEVKRAMIKSAKKVFLAIDNTKFQESAFCRIDTFDGLSGVLTDKKPDEEWMDIFYRKGIKVYYPTI